MIASLESAASLLRLPRRAEGLVPVLVNSAIPLLGLPRRAAVALATAVAIVVRKHSAAAKQSATGDQQQKNGFHGSFFWGIIAGVYRSQSRSFVRNSEHWMRDISIIPSHTPSARPLSVIVTIAPLLQGLAESTYITAIQPERTFIGRRDAEPEKCAAGNGNGENGSHWSAVGCRRWGQTGYQH